MNTIVWVMIVLSGNKDPVGASYDSAIHCGEAMGRIAQEQIIKYDADVIDALSPYDGRYGIGYQKTLAKTYGRGKLTLICVEKEEDTAEG